MSKWLASSAILAGLASFPRAPACADTLPPLTGRVIEYDTSEVTWPALAVAPDGKTILFDLLGDIYALVAQRKAGGLRRRRTPLHRR